MVEEVSWYNNGLDSLLGKTSKKGLKVQAYNRKTDLTEEVALDYLKLLKLKLNGFVKVDDRKYEGWSGSIPFYIYTCKSNGKKIFMLDYPHGYNERLDCKL
ncbi:hypothetical protein M1137_02185 [Candidatus Parvarchaeota archaeon]|jgi:hypothetical protein|nr:hypothetical protein [Candidatus Parvarchaeota archaeon]